MVWVFGNSHERVAIKDLGDVIYYRQKKQYTDQDFESSRDLQREIQKGRIIKLEHVPEIKGSLPDGLGNQQQNQTPTIDLREMRRVITEVMGENRAGGVNLKDLVTGLIPVLTGVVREEISKIPTGQVVGQGGSVQSGQTSTGPEYIPTVSTEGMKSSIFIEGKQVEGAGVSDSLNALKNLSRST
jgi:hypothetical protein